MRMNSLQAREIPSIPAISGDQQPTDMLRRRPDIIAAERRLAGSNERIGAAISEYYPQNFSGRGTGIRQFERWPPLYLRGVSTGRGRRPALEIVGFWEGRCGGCASPRC